jgi:hypothetical protein
MSAEGVRRTSVQEGCYELLVGRRKPSEQWKRRGKAEWPHHVTLVIPKRRLLDLASQLIRAYQLCGTTGDDNSDDLVLSGELRRCE